MYWRERRIPEETFQASVRFLQEQIARDSQNTRAYEDLAYLYNHRAASDHEEASDYAKKAIALNPEGKDGWVAYQEANNACCGDEWYDNHFTVIEYCKEVLQKHSDNFRALYTIIENMLADKRYDDAVPYIKKIGEVAPDTGQMLFYSGDVEYGHGNLEAAKKLWNQGVEKYAERWQSYCSRADRMKKLGYIEEAVADYEKCFSMQKAPHITDGLYSLAQIHESVGDIKAAIWDYERIIEVLAKDYQTTSGESVDQLRREIERLKKKS